jgi:hypothetical protein
MCLTLIFDRYLTKKEILNDPKTSSLKKKSVRNRDSDDIENLKQEKKAPDRTRM